MNNDRVCPIKIFHKGFIKALGYENINIIRKLPFQGWSVFDSFPISSSPNLCHFYFVFKSMCSPFLLLFICFDLFAIRTKEQHSNV